MTVTKRKKVTKYRGSKTHGCGSMKKRRGAGHRGGRGNAGSGKRADVKKPSNWKNVKYFGKHGFTVPGKPVRAITIQYIDEHVATFEGKKLIEKKQDQYVIDLAKLGYDKLLGTGQVKNKLSITAKFASPSAIEKVKATGGVVTVSTAKKEE